MLYSFDSASPSRAVGLDSLVEQAEARWVEEQTVRIVRGEYEVLDAEGETTVLAGAGAKKGKRGSPRQRAAAGNVASVVADGGVVEDEGFELV